MTYRTSVTHPLRIDSVKVATHSGEIGMTLCPGKYQEYAITGRWDRDLVRDLQVIKQWDTKVLISLMETKEFYEFKVKGLPEKLQALGIKWLHLPIGDERIPDEQFEISWKKNNEEFIRLINSEQKIVFHCLGGLGRTGLVVSRLLIEMGYTAEEAIKSVRQARPGAIETVEQEEYVRALTS
jgi:protein-tyrosine phosphatase